jgi:hypothetical protein
VFLFTVHRSGGTLLSRLLNCFPDLVIWGEHAGFLNKLAEAYALLADHAGLMQRTPVAIARYLAFDARARAGFDPWANPFGPDDFVTQCRRLLRDLFTHGVPQDQRWGFKEIRYHDPKLLAFLDAVFPLAQGVVLTRDPVELCISNMLAAWALERLEAAGVDRDRAEFLRAVEDCLYAIVAIERNLKAVMLGRADRVITVRYEALCESPSTELERVIKFLGLAVDRPIQARLDHVLAHVTGGTERRSDASNRQGWLAAAPIRDAAMSLLPRVREMIARDGADRARLRGLGPKGGYCYLLGDHHVGDPGISTLF